MKGQYNFGKQKAFLTCSWRFLRSNASEQLEFNLEKIYTKTGFLLIVKFKYFYFTPNLHTFSVQYLHDCEQTFILFFRCN